VEEETMNVQEWVEEYGRAWGEKDPDAVVALFTENAEYRSSPFREPDVGSEGIRAYWLRATSTQEEVDVLMGTPIVAGDKVAVEWWATMRDAGEQITLPGCLLLRFAGDGRCEALREYWHVEPGRHEPHADWGR
jgi:ketosteroid isomerase-like protein